MEEVELEFITTEVQQDVIFVEDIRIGVNKMANW